MDILDFLLGAEETASPVETMDRVRWRTYYADRMRRQMDLSPASSPLAAAASVRPAVTMEFLKAFPGQELAAKAVFAPGS